MQETMFQYELSPELAEQLSLEQTRVYLATLNSNWRRFAVALGILFGALVFSWSVPSETSARRIVDENLSFLTRAISGCVAAGAGFGVGFGVAWFIRSRVRNRALQQAREQTRTSYAKLGGSRTISWDRLSVEISSPVWQTKVSWGTVDEVTSGPVGIYVHVCGQVLFSIPKAALPSGLTSDDLIHAWRDCIARVAKPTSGASPQTPTHPGVAP